MINGITEKKNKQQTKLTSNMEDYLETIAALQKVKGVARVRDIGAKLKVKSSSVNSALQNLSDGGFVIHEKYGYVELTKEGKKIAAQIQDKHDILIKFLADILKVDKAVAAEDACKMEHTISQQTYEKIVEFVKYVEKCRCKRY